jgi:hypothetical protein
MKNMDFAPIFGRTMHDLPHADILELQDIFLTPGFHSLTVHDSATGRAVVTTMLSALKCYHASAVLTAAGTQDLELQLDLYAMLHQEASPLTYEALLELFLDHIHCDFLWIEATEKLTAESWYTDLQKVFIDLALDRHMPILSIRYQKTWN